LSRVSEAERISAVTVMRRTVPTPFRAGLAAALVALAAGAGTSLAGPPKKTHSPVTLRLALMEPRFEPSAKIAEVFAARVKKISGGALVVKTDYVTSKSNAPIRTREAQLFALVRGGKVALAITPTSALEAQGVTSFEAIQAPFLITTQKAMDRVTAGRIAAQLESGLPSIGLSALGLVPDGLRRPFGRRKALASPSAFVGARIVARPSALTWALLRALGARPLDPRNQGDGVRGIRGIESSLARAADPAFHYFTAGDLAFFPDLDALVGNTSALQRLSAGQRSILIRAASSARAWAMSALTEKKARNAFCKARSTIVNAPASALRALRAKAAPVLAMMRRDLLTRSVMREIERMGASRGGVAPCSHKPKPPGDGGPTVDSVIPAGVYRSPTYTVQQLIDRGGDPPGATWNAGTYTLTTTADGYQTMHQDDPEYPQYTTTCETRKMYLSKGLVVLEQKGANNCAGNIEVAWKLVPNGIEFTRVVPNLPIQRAYFLNVVWQRVG